MRARACAPVSQSVPRILCEHGISEGAWAHPCRPRGCPLCGMLNPGCLVSSLSQAAMSQEEAPSFLDPHLFLAALAPCTQRWGTLPPSVACLLTQRFPAGAGPLLQLSFPNRF